MNTNTRNIKRGVAIFVILLSISFIAGCYLKNQSEETADYLMPEKKIKGVTDKDINHFMSSLKVVDGQAESHYKLALYFQDHKRHKLAVEELSKALEQQPGMAWAYNAMGISYDKLGKPSQALHCYQLAIKLDPQMDSAYNNLGYSYLLEDDLDAAIAAFQKAIELNDQTKLYRNNLGLAYVMKGDYDQAKEQFKIIDNESKAEQKLAKLMNKLGKVKLPMEIAGKSKAIEETITADNSQQSEKPLVITKKIAAPEVQLDADKPVVVRKRIERMETVAESAANTQTYEPDQAGITIYGANTNKNHNTLPDQPIIISSAQIIPPKNFNQTGQDDTKSLPEERPQTSGVSVPAGNAGNTSPEIADPAITRPEPPTTAEPETQLADTRTVLAAATIVPAESDAGNTETNNVAQPPASSDSVITVTAAEPVRIADAKVEEAKPEQATVSIRETRPENPQTIITAAATDKAGSNATSADASNADQMTDSSVNDQTAMDTDTQQLVDAEIEVAKPKQSSVSVLETRQENSRMLIAAAATVKADSNATNAGSTTLDSSSDDQTILETEKEQLVDVEIVVANGNGEQGMARRVGNYLESRGFKVAKITNANSFDHATTKLFYSNGRIKDVRQLVLTLSSDVKQQNIIELKRLGNRIKIIVGKDLAPEGQMTSRKKSTANRS